MRTIYLAVVFSGGILALTAPRAMAQARQDTQLWSEASGSADVTEALSLKVEQSLRLGVDAGFARAHTDVEAAYRWHEMVSTSAHYRLLLYDGETRHRLAGDLDLRYRGLGSLRPSYRFRLQRTTRANDDALTLIRNRLKLGYDAPHALEPYAAFEIFHAVSPVTEFREHRIYFGCEWGVTEQTDVTGYLLILREHNVQMPDENLVFGVGLGHSFRDM